MCNRFGFLESELVNDPGEAITFMNDLAAQLDYGKHFVFTADIQKPLDSIRARTADPAHVKSLKASFKKWNNGPTDVQVLVMFKAGSVSSDPNIKVVDKLPSKNDFDFKEWYPTLKHHGFQVICGDHSVEAIKSLLIKFKTNPQWVRLNVQVFLGMFDNPDVSRFAKLWGTSDNLKKAVQRKVTVLEQLVETHRLFFQHPRIEEYVAFRKKPENKGKSLDWVRQFKEDRMAALNMKHGLWGHIWSIAKLDGPLWVAIEKIFTGRECSPNHVTPKSVSHFVHMADIPEADLLGWLNDIIIGEGTPCQFQALCFYYKARVFIRNKILHRLNVHFKRTKENPILWADACRQYRNVTDAAWIESYVPAIGNGQKKQLSEYFVATMTDRLNKDIDAIANKIAGKQQVFVFCLQSSWLDLIFMFCVVMFVDG